MQCIAALTKDKPERFLYFGIGRHLMLKFECLCIQKGYH